ncbi:hypothetical protein LAZ67_22001298 [Cordylochernes scorpioides]|uniref:Transposase Tc1-like domain-containing protein n=1 Tax=Cordylochernes scorpioides TaxID=51811 RepID=A0ABY6LT45_9ARAC|nr:hypothetical protein LAZ67_22001298 [Cordylochernes scorpioides]
MPGHTRHVLLWIVFNLAELFPRQLETIWQEIPQHTIRNLYQFMTRWVAACIQAIEIWKIHFFENPESAEVVYRILAGFTNFWFDRFFSRARDPVKIVGPPAQRGMVNDHSPCYDHHRSMQSWWSHCLDGFNYTKGHDMLDVTTEMAGEWHWYLYKKPQKPKDDTESNGESSPPCNQPKAVANNNYSSVCIHDGSGRPRATTEREDRAIVRMAVAAPESTLSTIQSVTGTQVSKMTINRRLRELNLRASRLLRCLPLTPVNRQVRLQWCRERSTWNCADWGRIVFSDESRFLLCPYDRRKRV